MGFYGTQWINESFINRGKLKNKIESYIYTAEKRTNENKKFSKVDTRVFLTSALQLINANRNKLTDDEVAQYKKKIKELADNSDIDIDAKYMYY